MKLSTVFAVFTAASAQTSFVGATSGAATEDPFADLVAEVRALRRDHQALQVDHQALHAHHRTLQADHEALVSLTFKTIPDVPKADDESETKKATGAFGSRNHVRRRLRTEGDDELEPTKKQSFSEWRARSENAKPETIGPILGIISIFDKIGDISDKIEAIDRCVHYEDGPRRDNSRGTCTFGTNPGWSSTDVRQVDIDAYSSIDLSVSDSSSGSLDIEGGASISIDASDSISIDSEGTVDIDAYSSIDLSAGSDISIDGGGDITISASGSVDIQGMPVNSGITTLPTGMNPSKATGPVTMSPPITMSPPHGPHGIEEVEETSVSSIQSDPSEDE